MLSTSGLSEFLDIVKEASLLLALPENDFSWSSWDNALDALEELKDIAGTVGTDEESAHRRLALLFAPTGPIQEVSLSSDWADEFLKLAERFEQIADDSAG